MHLDVQAAFRSKSRRKYARLLKTAKNLRRQQAGRSEGIAYFMLCGWRPSPLVASLPQSSAHQSRNRGAEVRLRRIPELRDEGVVLERLLHDAALNAFSPSVNQPHLA
jgi:hypothetical protein